MHDKPFNRILVLDGGGQLGSFQWGAMCELARKGYDSDYFDAFVCSSAGAFNAAYFLTKQYEEGKHIWLEFLPKVFWKTFSNDMGGLEKILRKLEPLNTNLIRNQNKPIFVQYTNVQTRESECLYLNEQKDIIEALLACCAMPFLSGSRKLNGTLYYDGGLSAQPPLDYALSLSPTEVWLILTEPSGYRLTPWKWKTLSFLAFFDKSLNRLLKNLPMRRNAIYKKIECEGEKYKVIRPANSLPIRLRDTNTQRISQAFDLGVQAADSFLLGYRII